MKSFAFLIILSPGLVSINSYVTGLCCQLLCYWSLLSEVQNDQVHYTSIQINIKRQHASRFHAQLLYQLIKPNLYRHQQKCDHQRDTTETAVCSWMVLNHSYIWITSSHVYGSYLKIICITFIWTEFNSCKCLVVIHWPKPIRTLNQVS